MLFAEIEYGFLGLPAHFAGDLLAVLVFGLIAALVITFGTKGFDWLYKQVDFEKEVGANNLAAAAVVAAVIIGLSMVMSTTIYAVIGR